MGGDNKGADQASPSSSSSQLPRTRVKPALPPMLMRDDSAANRLMAGYKCAVSRDTMSMLGVMYDRSWATTRREAVEESLQCSRAVSQPAEEAAHSPLRAAAGR